MGLLVIFLPTFQLKMYVETSEEALVIALSMGSLVSSYFFCWLSDRVGPLPILKALAIVAIVLPLYRSSYYH